MNLTFPRPSPHSSQPDPLLYPHHLSTWLIGLSCFLLAALFFLIGQIDHPTLTLVHGLAEPMADQIGNIGNKLGDGLSLVLISLGVGAVGLWRQSDQLKLAAFYSLLAHGISGLLTQILKHTLSRPRPRLMDTTPWDIGPTLESGLDSFPSGHASASFSVATVLAFYFPKGRVLWFALAGFVAVCRVIKGSHFPTDVLGGLLLGIGTGLLLVYARDRWKDIAARAFVHGLPWIMTAFGLLWILVPHPGIELVPNLPLFVSVGLIMMGLGIRLWWIRKASIANPVSNVIVPSWPRVLMGLGLASSTGSVIVIGASAWAGAIWWLGTSIETSRKTGMPDNQGRPVLPIWLEIALGTGFCVTALISNMIRSF